MPITMQNYSLTWTDAKGVPRASAVAYDKPSVDRRKTELERAGATDIDIVEVKPGELPAPRG
ncbi:hypothetical protein [Streptomyces sp. NPDC000351]|uniref:hypothetical protein n=1 Tax=Streptomyces sp. NPDC000351 TaxID=3154250 RepID=UPI003322D40D